MELPLILEELLKHFFLSSSFFLKAIMEQLNSQQSTMKIGYCCLLSFDL